MTTTSDQGLHVMRRTLLAFIALTVAMLLGAAAANATKQVAATFGASCTDPSACGDGEFAGAGPVAVNQSTGQVHVIDVGNSRVQRFSATGSYQAQFTTTATTAIAVDQASGNLYLVNQANNIINQYNAAGTLLGTIGTACATNPCGDGELSSPSGVAVDPTNGDVVVADTANNRIQRFTSAGAYVSQLGGTGNFTSPTRVVVDGAGRIAVLDAGTGRVKRFSANSGSSDLLVDTTGPIAAPSEMTVDPDTGHLYVFAYAADFSSSGIFELDDAGNIVDQHAPNAFGAAGLTIRPDSGRLYATSGDTVFVVDDVTAPTVAVTAPTSVTAREATLHGTANPEGGLPVSWQFELSDDDGATWQSAGGGGDSVTGTSDVPVSADLNSLIPNKTYLVRLAATPQYAPATVSEVLSFNTPGLAPEVRTTYVLDVDTSSAMLGAAVIANNDETGYHFEYGTTTAYGSRIPVADVSLGAGGTQLSSLTALQRLKGLSPNTTYNFRILATNSAGTAASANRTFRTDESAQPFALSDGRAYEKVSPDDKNGGDIAAQGETTFASVDGNRAAFASRVGFVDTTGSGLVGQVRYVASRGPTGWRTHAVTPRSSPEALQIYVLTTGLPLFSTDFSSAIVKAYDLPDVTGDLPKAGNLYHQDIASKSLRVISQNPAGGSVGVYGVDDGLRGWSPDLLHVAFESSDNLVAGATGTETKLYVWDDGHLRLASILPNGNPPAGPASSPADVDSVPSDYNNWHGDVLSADGRRVLFTAPMASSNAQLFSRVDGTTTEWISQSEASLPDPDPQGIRFAGASPDGRSIAFTSDTPLVDADPGGPGKALYLFRGTAHPEVDYNLTFISRGLAPDGEGSQRFHFNGFVGMSDDGTYVYYNANNQLHRWRAGDDRVIPGPLPSDLRTPDDEEPARVSRNGRRLAFLGPAPEIAGPEPTSVMYVYDDHDGSLRCVSCPPSGAAPREVTRVRQWGATSLIGTNSEQMRMRYLTPDGRRVFFSAPDALVPADVNERYDVYEYDLDSRQVKLISTGHGEDAWFNDASANGDDVFFTTRNQLVDSDKDDNFDLYDARVHGGFTTASTPASCSEDCQTAPPAPPQFSAPASSVLRIGKDRPVVARPMFTVAALSVTQRKRLAATGKGSLAVRVSAAGRLTVTTKAAIGRRWRAVTRRLVRTATRPGVIRVGLNLSDRAQRWLSNTGRLNLKLTVAFAGGREPKRVSMTLTTHRRALRRSSSNPGMAGSHQ